MKKLLLISLLFCSIAKAQLVPPLYSIFNRVFSYDADALAFFTAASITDNTQKNAINTLVVSLKSNSLWTKFVAIYPFVGGTSSAHAVNLKTPGTFDITFFGSPTHDANGVAFNGTSQYANTGIVPSTSLSQDDVHLSYYSRTDGATAYEMGAVTTAGGSNYLDINIKSGDNNTYSAVNSSEASLGAIVSTGVGFFISIRTNSTAFSFYQNGSSIGSRTTTSAALTSRTITINALNNNGGINSFSNRACSFASVGTSFTSGEASTFSTIVNTFETSLSRNTY